jgi:hypothetical protein
LPRKHEFKPSFPQKKFKKGNKPWELFIYFVNLLCFMFIFYYHIIVVLGVYCDTYKSACKIS